MPPAEKEAQMTSLKTTARITGVLYLGLAITGLLGFIVIRSALYDPADAAATAANLVNKEWLARLGIAMELGIVLTQALVAVWFYMLFRSAHAVAAGAIAAFGMVNAVAILVSAVALTGALEVALDPALAPGGDAAATAQLMYALSAAAWAGGQLFFGLWLIPMGYAVIVSGWMPRLLGQILMVGGAAYVLSAFVSALLPEAPVAVEVVLTGLATIGEFWMIGYLLIFGVRDKAEESAAG
jgi:hypothetical protein